MQIVDSLKSALNSSEQPVNNAEMILYRDIAMFYAWIGEIDETLDWMEGAVSWSHHAIDFRYVDSGIFAKVLGDTGFRSGLERIRTRARERIVQASG